MKSLLTKWAFLAGWILWSGCNYTWGMHSGEPNRDLGPVFVQVAENQTFYPELPRRLTRALNQTLRTRAHTVVTGQDPAKLNVSMQIIKFSKSVLSETQVGEIRENQATLTVEVTLADQKNVIHQVFELSRTRNFRVGTAIALVQEELVQVVAEAIIDKITDGI